MKKGVIAVFIFIVVIVVILFLIPRAKKETPEKPVLSATVLPLSMILEHVAGSEFTVITVVPSGASPHTYEPTPTSIGKLRGAETLFAIGHGLDDWSASLTKSAGVESRVVVDSGIEITNDNPHYFLSPLNAAVIARTIATELSRIYPDKSKAFEERARQFGISMDTVVSQAKRDFNSIGNPQIATFHSVLDYFARDLGISVAAVFEEYPGKDPTPSYMKEFEQNVKKSGVRVIYAEPQFGTSLLVPIAKDLDVDIAVLDPEGSVTGATTYEALILSNVQIIVSTHTQ